MFKLLLHFLWVNSRLFLPIWKSHNHIEPRETKAGSETNEILGRDNKIIRPLSWLNYCVEQFCNTKYVWTYCNFFAKVSLSRISFTPQVFFIHSCIIMFHYILKFEFVCSVLDRLCLWYNVVSNCEKYEKHSIGITSLFWMNK